MACLTGIMSHEKTKFMYIFRLFFNQYLKGLKANTLFCISKYILAFKRT